jgi:hypothetical protein
MAHDQMTEAVVINRAKIHACDGGGYAGVRYRCPACTKTSIRSHHSFCPMCGVRIEWTGAFPDLPLHRRIEKGAGG